MKARLDTPFESWGGFSKAPTGSPIIHGLLRYTPGSTVEVELADNPDDARKLLGPDEPPRQTLFGQLVNGKLVTLDGCQISNAAIPLVGIGAPTRFRVHRAVFGRHVRDLDQLSVKRYSIELSSLANWSGEKPVAARSSTEDPNVKFAFDLRACVPAPLDVLLPDQEFDVRIAHTMNTRFDNCSVDIEWGAGITIVAHKCLPLETIAKVAWQFQNLMSLLIGEQLSTRAVSVTPADSDDENAMALVYQQAGRHDREDVYPAEIMVPYPLIRNQFPTIVQNWMDRTEQAVLASNVFFGSQRSEAPAVNVRFLAMAQAAESYHRALGIGFYMKPEDYDAAIRDMLRHMPDTIQGDHRTSLKNRLKYGNEYSLRKRLTEMLRRLPDDVRREIAGDEQRFVSKVVDTRNYYTHYDHKSQKNAFDGKQAYVASERVRILIVANMLQDFGIQDEHLLSILKRKRDFEHWMSQPLWSDE